MLDNKHFAWYYNDKVNDEDGITENPDNYLKINFYVYRAICQILNAKIGTRNEDYGFV